MIRCRETSTKYRMHHITAKKTRSFLTLWDVQDSAPDRKVTGHLKFFIDTKTREASRRAVAFLYWWIHKTVFCLYQQKVKIIRHQAVSLIIVRKKISDFKLKESASWRRRRGLGRKMKRKATKSHTAKQKKKQKKSEFTFVSPSIKST